MQPIVIENQIETEALPVLTQLSGTKKGRVFYLSSIRTTLGRADSNHVVIEDESVSRVHAIIEKNEDGTLVILDNRSRNGMLINRVRTEAAVLQPGDEISLGAIVFKIHLPQRNQVAASDFPQEGPAAELAPPKSGINKRFLIYGGLGLLLVLVLVTNNPNEKKEKDQSEGVSKASTLKVDVSAAPKTPSTKESVEGTPIDLTKNPVEIELEKLVDLDVGIEDSEIHFRKGQREYFNKNYHRAISSLELALSLNRTHPSAGYYLQSAIHQAEEEASKNLEMGLKYFESLQYKRAIYHFKQVKSLLAHKPEDNLIKKCDEYIRLAEQRLKAAELYP